MIGGLRRENVEIVNGSRGLILVLTHHIIYKLAMHLGVTRIQHELSKIVEKPEIAIP